MWNRAASLSIFLLTMYIVPCKTDQHDDKENGICSIEIMPDNLDYARREFESLLENDARMVYIYLKSDEKLKSFLKDKYKNDEGKEYHSLTNWVWSSKEYSYLHSLPVDIDAATFGLMRHDVYDMEIELDVTGYLQNCSSNFNKTYNYNILFDYLYRNVTMTENNEGYLCKRIYDGQTMKEILYIIFGIWSGYDFLCYHKTFENYPSTTVITKSISTIILYVFHFIIVNFFPFIFVFLCSEAHTHTYIDKYVEGDTPYSPRRFLHRFLHYHRDQSDKGEDKSSMIPQTRLFLIPQTRLFLIFCLVCIFVFMFPYFFLFKIYIKNPDNYNDIYKFYKVSFWLSIATFLFFMIVLLWSMEISEVFAFRLRMYNEKGDKLIVMQCINIKELVKFRTSDEMIQKLVLRMTVFFSPGFWKYMFAGIFVGKCWQKFLGIFVTLLNILLMFINILFFWVPTIWLFTLIFQHCFERKDKKAQEECRTTKRIAFFLFVLGCLALYICSLIYQCINSCIYGPISYLTRMVTYTIFVAIPYNLDSKNIYIVMIVITTTSYGLKCITSFLSLYKNILKLMFEIKKESFKKSISTITTVEFDLVIEKTFPVGLSFCFMVLKIVIVTTFIYISTTVLANNKQDDGITRSILVEYIFVMISPAVLMKLFFRSAEQTVRQKKQSIIEAMEKAQSKGRRRHTI